MGASRKRRSKDANAQSTPADLDDDSAERQSDADVGAVTEAAGSDAGPTKLSATGGRRPGRSKTLVYGVLPGLALLLALAAGYFKYQVLTLDSGRAATESLQAAKDSTVALLSYEPSTVEQQLAAARDRTTGPFRDSYTKLIDDIVVPGAKQQQISAVVAIPAATSVSADDSRAVALVFVNQVTTVGKDKPSGSVSSVRVTLDKVDDRWLVSGFDPV